MASFSDSTIFVAETQERIARAKAQTYRLHADHALTTADRDHLLILARLQQSIADGQRCIIDSLIQFRNHAKTMRGGADET